MRAHENRVRGKREQNARPNDDLDSGSNATERWLRARWLISIERQLWAPGHRPAPRHSGAYEAAVGAVADTRASAIDLMSLSSGALTGHR